MAANPYAQYQMVSIETASPAQLVVMLYDGVTRFCAGAEAALRSGDTAGARDRIRRAQAIVEELLATLDTDAGGEVAENLHQLYQYANARLIHAGVYQGPEPVAEVGRVFRELRSGWAELARGVGAAPGVGR